jgi:hypothetical protein
MAVLLEDFVDLLLHVVNFQVPDHHVEVISAGMVWRLVLAFGGQLILILGNALGQGLHI